MNAILLIGKPHSGKTTFIAQLCAKVETGNSILKLYKAIENLTPIVEASQALAKGQEVTTTPTDKSTVINLPLLYKNQMIDLNCPDYGGEQINKIIENREVDSKWSKSIKSIDNWILFIRPTSIATSYDLSNKTIKPEVLEQSTGQSDEYSISDQSSYIELIQILLNVKGQDAHFKNSTTKLTVALTCWDELKNPSSPREELQKSLPLLMEFISSNWVEEKLSILGLSAQGFSLDVVENQKKYSEIGPENFGYLILPDGKQTEDITELILSAIS